ncbi:hypothetical protein VTK73DRAFT_5109 [Phialemonium thermophilum]|uniref:FAD dependent oxidoreductase domain-containing protein n=1 Tax=Phialemonium thermophilum TaxID=223376 RepID=A0ABR3V3C4_9PEZI
MPSPLTKTSSILIVGGGTWGCSTALHLARRGYTNVTVLDGHEIPSPISAGNDVNKIVEQGSFSEGDEEGDVAQALLAHAKEGWLHDPVSARCATTGTSSASSPRPSTSARPCPRAC